MLLTRRLHNDGAHASYRVHLKVRTIDSWLAERGTGSALPNLRLHESFLAPSSLLCVSSASRCSSQFSFSCCTRGYDWHVLMKSSMRQSHRRHRICQTLIAVHVLSVPG